MQAAAEMLDQPAVCYGLASQPLDVLVQITSFLEHPDEGEVAHIHISAEVLLRGLLDLQELRAQVLNALIESN